MREPAGFAHLSLPRILIVAGGEPAGDAADSFGKTSRLIDHARRVVQRSGAVADVLDLGWLDQSKQHPASALSSPLSSPLSSQVRERWNAAHGVMVFVPERWNTAESSLRFLIDELARDATQARQTSYGVIVQREDCAALPDDPVLGAHLKGLGLVSALDSLEHSSGESYPGYYAPGDANVSTDRSMHERVRKVATAVVEAAKKLRCAMRGQRNAAILAL